jgi:hypothetical protein
MPLLLNYVAFQVGWFACVLGAANQLPWLGPVVVCALLALHLYLAPHALEEGKLLLVTGIIGLAWDSLLVALGLLVYPSGMLVAGMAPYWIVAMWMHFATTFNISLGWLKGRPLIAAVLGGTGGPLAYYAGFQLGGVAFPAPGPALAALALGWAVMMPVLLYLAERFNGFAPRVLETRYA